MKNLIKKLPEQYQDIEYQGKLYKGKRDCQKRWEMIRNYFKPYDVVMDLGSSLGYFSKKLALEYPSMLIVSFESEPEMIDIQKEIFRSEGIYNVILCEHRLKASDLINWMMYVDSFDVVLALSVLHHIPAPELYTYFNALQCISDRIIGEVPEVLEEEACGGESKEMIWKLINNRESIGKVSSHLGEYLRELWYIDRKEPRENLDAFFGVSHADRHKFKLEDGRINGKNTIKGLNVWNLLHFNIKWPEPIWWQKQAVAAYECLDSKSDVRPWNLLVTSTGLKAIDYMTEFPKGDKAEYKKEHLDKLKELFKTMKPGELY